MKTTFQKANCFVWILAVSLVSGCTFKFDVTSQKTALENQAMGKYEELPDEVILTSSVRGGTGTRGQLDSVTMAKQNQKFNLDDILELKGLQVIGETKDGLVALLPPGLVGDAKPTPDQISLAKAVTAEENSDRKTIWADIIANNKNLSANDEGEVRKTYAKQMRDEAKPGQWLQDPSGNWNRKKSD
jgi:uncharacterized protein YdbL (DUF1318 family)